MWLNLILFLLFLAGSEAQRERGITNLTHKNVTFPFINLHYFNAHLIRPAWPEYMLCYGLKYPSWMAKKISHVISTEIQRFLYLLFTCICICTRNHLNYVLRENYSPCGVEWPFYTAILISIWRLLPIMLRTIYEIDMTFGIAREQLWEFYFTIFKIEWETLSAISQWYSQLL